MAGVVIGFFIIQQQNIQGSIVSPMEVLSERDALEIFEGKELVLIENSLSQVDDDFGSDDFHDSFRENFIEGVMSDDYMREFIFANLSIDGNEIRERDKNLNLVENGLYPKSKSSFDDGKFVFVRSKVEKNYLMRAKGEDKINFPVYFNFEFERKYLIEHINDKFVVEIL